MATVEAQAYLEDFKQHIARTAAVSSLTIDDQRVVAEGLQAMTGTPDGVAWRDAAEDAVPGVWTEPTNQVSESKDPVILYVHGGGYMFGSPVGYRNLVGHIVRASGVRALTPVYGLAPERPFPAGLDDQVAAYKALRAAGTRADKIVVVGDSAGGGLALGLLLKLRDMGEDLPAAAVLMSPFADLEASGESYVTNSEVDILATAESMRSLGRIYAPDDILNPYASPILGDYVGLPRLLIQVGGHETLQSDSVRIQEIAQAADVTVDLEIFPEMQHVFQFGAGRVPEADDAVAKVGAFIRSVLVSTPAARR